MKIQFYKAPGTIIDKLIRFWTNSKYSHNELQFSNGVSFSSSTRDNGCRFKYIEYDPNKWDSVEFTLSPEKERMVKEFCIKNSGKAYDYLALFFTFFIQLGIHGKDKFVCSEITVLALQQAGLLTYMKASETDPQELYEEVASIFPS